MKTFTKTLVAVTVGLCGSLDVAEAGSYGDADGYGTTNGIAAGGCYGPGYGTGYDASCGTGYGKGCGTGYDANYGYGRDRSTFRDSYPYRTAAYDRTPSYDRWNDRADRWSRPSLPTYRDCDDYSPNRYDAGRYGSTRNDDCDNGKLGSAWPGRSASTYSTYPSSTRRW